MDVVVATNFVGPIQTQSTELGPRAIRWMAVQEVQVLRWTG